MKIYNLLILIAMSIFIFSCEEEVTGCTDSSACNYNADATENDGSCTYETTWYDCNNNFMCDNHMEISGKGTYDLDGMNLFLDYGDYYSNGTTNIDLTLFSSGIGFDGYYFNGYGHSIYFVLNTNGSPTGTYTFDSNGTNGLNTFSSQYFYEEDLDTYYYDYVTYWDIASGNISIAQNGNSYEIFFDLVDVDGFEVSGCHEGPIDIFDSTTRVAGKPVFEKK